MPKVSICIPTYKQPALFQRALDSVFKQKYKDYEIIITDDTPDESVERIVDKYKRRKNIFYIRNKERKGSPGNWNECLKYTKGEYIKFLHHDDWFMNENSLGEFVKLLDDHPESNFAFSGAMNYDSQDKVTYQHYANDDQIQKQKKDFTYIILGNFIGAPSATIYRSKVNKLFDLKLKWLVDIDFYVQIFRDNPNFVYTKNPLIAILDEAPTRVTAESLGNKEVEVVEFLHVYQKLSSFNPNNVRRYRHLWNLIERFSIKSKEEIVELGFNEPFPTEVYSILTCQKFYRTYIRIWNNLKRIFSVEKWGRLIFTGLSLILFFVNKLLKK